MSKLTDTISSLKIFSNKDESVIGVDVGASSIKVVQLRKQKGVVVLETYGELALGPYEGLEIGRATNLDVSKLSEAIKDLLREASVTTKSSGFAIPLTSSLLTFIQMPAVGTKQLNKMIPIEARKYIPVPINEVMLDWFIIEDADTMKAVAGRSDHADEIYNVVSLKTDVLLVAIHNEVLNNFNSIVEKSGLVNDFFEIEIFSAIRSLLDQNLTPEMIIDIGSAATKVYIVETGVIRVSHIVNKGSQDITLGIAKASRVVVSKAEEMKRLQGLSGDVGENTEVQQIVLSTLDYIFSEANRVLLNYQKKYSKVVTRVVLTGGGSVMKGIVDFAKRQLGAEVVLGDPFSKVDAPAFLSTVLKEAGPSFGVALGLALRKLQDLD